MGSHSNNISVETHLKGIHDTVKIIQLELEGMRKDIRAMNNKSDASSVDGGSGSKPSNSSQTRKLYLVMIYVY